MVLALCLYGFALPVQADDDSGGKFNWLQQLGQSSDNSADNSQGTPVTGVRGLEETSGKVDTKARDYAAVDRMEKVQITDAELQQFVAEGKLQ